MRYKRITRLSLVGLMFSLLSVDSPLAAENVRVAYPSMGTSVFCLIIAQKEGYLKEEGLDVQLLSIRGEIAIRTTLAGEVDIFTNAGSALAAAVRAVPVTIVTIFKTSPVGTSSLSPISSRSLNCGGRPSGSCLLRVRSPWSPGRS